MKNKNHMCVSLVVNNAGFMPFEDGLLSKSKYEKDLMGN